MNLETWYKHFDEDPSEELGRNVKGIFGEPMLIVLPRITWAWLDWMESENSANVEEFFIRNQETWTPEHGCRHKAFHQVVHKSFLAREKKGLSRPDWCDPAPPEELLDFELE